MRSSGNMAKGLIRFGNVERRYANIADGIELPSFNMANPAIAYPNSNRKAFDYAGLTERSPGTDKSGFYATEVMSARHTPFGDI